LESDREAIEVGLYSAIADGSPRVCRIKNTAVLDEMWISEALLPEAKREASVTVETEPGELPFNGSGDLL
jgi:hypothetical protein